MGDGGTQEVCASVTPEAWILCNFTVVWQRKGDDDVVNVLLSLSTYARECFPSLMLFAFHLFINGSFEHGLGIKGA